MEEQCKSNVRPLLDDMRLVEGMMRMGERIAFGRDADLLERAAMRITELEAALYKAHGVLGGLSMGTEGHLRRRVCTVYNIVGKPLGKGRSSHGDEADE